MKKHLVLLAVLAATACSPIIATRGNLISDSKFKEVRAQSATRADVEQKWGPPTTVSTLNPNVWYYIGETTSQSGIFAPKVDKRRMVRVTFDAMDTVTEVADIDPKLAREVEMVDRKTPTAGKEFTVLQQMIGNVGKFNTGTEKK
jgi:outer membrane protein assembly factor BamE (lipoprotein component of BamABCDE complex)